MKIKVDKNTCIGCGACTQIAEGVFEINDDGFAEIVNNPEKNKEKEVVEAIESCPVGAIKED